MKRFYVVLSISLGLAGLSSLAKADEWDKRTVITFNRPVEIPGRVLAAGTYVMKLADSQSDRNVVQFFDKDEKHLDAMVMAIPVYRINPPDQTVITFEERAANAPQAIKEWFYPGDNTGEEFIYKKPVLASAASFAPANLPVQPPVASVAPKPVQAAVAPAATPQAQQPVEIAQAKPAPPAPASPAPANTQLPKELPKTASDLPLVALLGSASLFAGIFLRRIA